MAREVAKRNGWKLELIPIKWGEKQQDIDSGKIDCIWSSFTINGREELFTWSEPYWENKQVAVVKKDSPIKTLADLAGKKVSVQTGTTAESFCMAENYKVSSFAANNDAEMALVKGKVDAWVIDDLTAADMVAAYNKDHDDKLVILSEAMTTEPYAFAFAKSNTELVEQINAVLKELLEAGTVAEIFEAYEAPYTAPEVAE